MAIKGHVNDKMRTLRLSLLQKINSCALNTPKSDWASITALCYAVLLWVFGWVYWGAKIAGFVAYHDIL